MPRLPPSLLHRANRISPYLATLLPACRDLRSAQNELRWIREHVLASSPASQSEQNYLTAQRRIAGLCVRRARGEPLQYVLGSQPFGPLEIKCRNGVLIPRPETEAWVYFLADLIVRRWAERWKEEMRIVDLCSGSGCIALLLYGLLMKARGPMEAGLRAKVAGYDVSARAVESSRLNLRENIEGGLLPSQAREDVVFSRDDVFNRDWMESLHATLAQDERRTGRGRGIHVLVSNPPYVSATGFAHDTGRSVRNFEPKLALVPGGLHADELGGCRPEDVFYRRLVEIARVMRPEVSLFEVGDLEQAVRVVTMAVTAMGKDAVGVEIWRDWPDMEPENDEVTELHVDGMVVPVRGNGHGRSVLLYSKRSIE